MAGVKFNRRVCAESKAVNATQILCDLYIDIVPTVLLNKTEHGAHLNFHRTQLKKLNVALATQYRMERDNLTTSPLLLLPS